MTLRRSPRRAATVAALALAAAVVPLPDAPPAGTAYAAVAPASDLLRAGDSGPEVQTLQERLSGLGYWLGAADGEYGTDTSLAVQALQKAAGIARDGIVGPDTRAALDEGVRPSARTSQGRAVEIDLERQLLMTVEDGQVREVFSTSTGSGEPYSSRGGRYIATTPTGSYQVFREVDAWDPGPLGALYRPKYFNGGIAVHGYGSVPPYPASHGCARVGLRAMDHLWESGYLDVYDTVLVR